MEIILQLGACDLGKYVSTIFLPININAEMRAIIRCA